MKTLIIQYSPPHTASTFLLNALYGLIPSLSDKPGIYDDFSLDSDSNIYVIKTHNNDIDGFMSKYSSIYKLYFICSERVEKNIIIDKKFKLYNNFIVFSYNELNETITNTIPIIIENIYNKINNILNIELNIEGGINRIIAMNKLYDEIKNKDFSYFDLFYIIHGSHRNRKE